MERFWGIEIGFSGLFRLMLPCILDSDPKTYSLCLITLERGDNNTAKEGI